MSKADIFREAFRLEEENKRLQQWVDDLQSEMYINCVYCGHRYGPSDEVPASMAEILKQHVEVCPKHPMSVLKNRIDALRNFVKGELENCLVWDSNLEYAQIDILNPEESIDSIRKKILFYIGE